MQGSWSRGIIQVEGTEREQCENDHSAFYSDSNSDRGRVWISGMVPGRLAGIPSIWITVKENLICASIG